MTANFIKEPGLEINRPESDTSETQENATLIAIGASEKSGWTAEELMQDK